MQNAVPSRKKEVKQAQRRYSTAIGQVQRRPPFVTSDTTQIRVWWGGYVQYTKRKGGCAPDPPVMTEGWWFYTLGRKRRTRREGGVKGRRERRGEGGRRIRREERLESKEGGEGERKGITERKWRLERWKEQGNKEEENMTAYEN